MIKSIYTESQFKAILDEYKDLDYYKSYRKAIKYVRNNHNVSKDINSFLNDIPFHNSLYIHVEYNDQCDINHRLEELDYHTVKYLSIDILITDRSIKRDVANRLIRDIHYLVPRELHIDFRRYGLYKVTIPRHVKRLSILNISPLNAILHKEDRYIFFEYDSHFDYLDTTCDGTNFELPMNYRRDEMKFEGYMRIMTNHIDLVNYSYRLHTFKSISADRRQCSMINVDILLDRSKDSLVNLHINQFMEDKYMDSLKSLTNIERLRIELYQYNPYVNIPHIPSDKLKHLEIHLHMKYEVPQIILEGNQIYDNLETLIIVGHKLDQRNYESIDLEKFTKLKNIGINADDDIMGVLSRINNETSEKISVIVNGVQSIIYIIGLIMLMQENNYEPKIMNSLPIVSSNDLKYLMDPRIRKSEQIFDYLKNKVAKVIKDE